MLAEPEAAEVNTPKTARDRLIIALDCENRDVALRVVDSLGDDVGFYKVGYRLFFGEGLPFVKEMQRERRKKVFVDLKLNDIDETITDGVRALREYATFMTLHGNGATARAAIKGRDGHDTPKFLSVTLLSSLDRDDLHDMFSVAGVVPQPDFVESYIHLRSKQAIDAGCDGLIASGESIRSLRQKFGDKVLIVSPGIRPSGSSADDHKRSATPTEAIRWGADYLVVGRPIRMGAPSPRDAALLILDEMDAALATL